MKSKIFPIVFLASILVGFSAIAAKISFPGASFSQASSSSTSTSISCYVSGRSPSLSALGGECVAYFPVAFPKETDIISIQLSVYDGAKGCTIKASLEHGDQIISASASAPMGGRQTVTLPGTVLEPDDESYYVRVVIKNSALSNKKCAVYGATVNY